MPNKNALGPRPLLIGDRWVQGGGEPIPSVDPASGEINAYVSTAASEDVDAAVTAANNALRASSWRELLPHLRADYLHRIAQKLLENAQHLGELVMHENGKTLRECVTQARSAAATFRYYASLCETLESQVTPSRGDYISLTT